MSLIELAVRRPVATGVIYVFLGAAGVLSWSRLPQEVMPNLNFPQLTIVTSYAQAAPQEIENLVTKPIEEAVGTVKNVRRLRSLSKEGTSLVTVEFFWGTNMDFASLNVREKLDLVKSRLPSEVREPTVIKYNPFDVPVIILSLSSEEAGQAEFLSHVAKQTIANRLQKVEGVAAVSSSGLAEKEIHVDLDQSRLAAHRVSLLQFNQGLAQANYRGAAGTAREGSYDYAVRVVSPFDSVPDIEKAVIAVDNPLARTGSVPSERITSLDRLKQRALHGDQRLIAVSQLGSVKEGLKERGSVSRYDGKDTITITLQKQAAASTIGTVRRIQEAVTELKALLPKEVSLDVIYDQAVIIKKGIGDVLSAIFGGGLLAFLVLYLFLKSWRDALIVSVVIPASAAITVIVMDMMGLSLNIISMGGLALGLGMLVDASICVTENVYRHRDELGKKPVEAAIQGTKEVAGAVTSSNLTSIAVFLPLLFVLGLLGQLFRDLSITVTVSQVVSIIVSLTLVPMLAVVMGRSPGQRSSPEKEPAESKGTVFLNLRNWYVRQLNFAFDRPKKVWGAILVAFLISLVVLGLLPTEFMPRVDAAQLVGQLALPNGTRLERTDEVARRIEGEIRSLPEIQHVATTVGSSSDSPLVLLGKNEARFLIDLKKKRRRSADAIIEDLREKMAKFPRSGGSVKLTIAGGPMSFAQGANSLLMVYLKGTDMEKLKRASESLMEELSRVKGWVQVRSSLALPAPEVRLQVDKERAARSNLNVSEIGQTVMAAYHGKNVTQVYREGQEIPVRVRLEEGDRQNIQQLRTLLLPAAQGGTIPLQDVARLDIGEGPSQIERLDQERCVLLQADPSADYGRFSRRAVEKIIKGFSRPDVRLEEAGEKQAQRESFLSLFFTILVSILLVFMVMAIQFESLKQPFLILFTIPLSVIGMAAGLFITGKTLNAVAGMGLLLLAGIVVNNGIVLIDFVNTERGPTASSMREVLKRACQTRLRPIMLTATSTIVGLAPLAFGIGEGAQLQAPMAITVIFGLAFSTVLTLIALPTLFLYVEKRLGNM
ncbi:MAG: efflux RND transporter permease subunit [Elusimicrobia bacterium]|nr:efflux RND transporter permease subunit [Candidatus Obscuribacterium magneticum]